MLLNLSMPFIQKFMIIKTDNLIDKVFYNSQDPVYIHG